MPSTSRAAAPATSTRRKPDYYLHLNARILGQAEQLGCDTLLTICNVCTLNLRQANKQAPRRRGARARQRQPAQVGAAPYTGSVEVRHLLWEISEGDGYERFKEIAVQAASTGLKVAPFYGCQILRPSKLLGFEDPTDPSRSSG